PETTIRVCCSKPSQTAANRNIPARRPTVARFKWFARISGEKPTDSISLVKQCNSYAGVWTVGVEHCMFAAVQLRTDAFDQNFRLDRRSERHVRHGESVLCRIESRRDP